MKVNGMRRLRGLTAVMCLMCCCVWISPLQAGVPGKIVAETVEFLLKPLGREAVERTASTLPRRVETLVAAHGDEALVALRKGGLPALEAAEQSGSQAPIVIKLFADYGEKAVWVVSKPRSLAIFVRHGDDAARALTKHGSAVVEPLENFGVPALKAAAALDSRNARRLAMLADDPLLKSSGRAEAIFSVLKKGGDRAMDFVWRNKAALAVSSVLTAFLLNPEPFIDGTIALTETVILQTPVPRRTSPDPGEASATGSGGVGSPLIRVGLGIILAAILLSWCRRLVRFGG